MKSEKRKNNFGLVLIILVICFIFGAGGFYLDSKFSDDNQGNNDDEMQLDDTNNSDSDKNNNGDSNEMSTDYDWMDYIMNSDISFITVTYCVDKNIDEGMIASPEDIEITKDDLKRIFTEMKKGSVVKDYVGGFGGPCMWGVDINYSTDKNYELTLFLNRYVSTDDKKILSLLELEDYTIEYSYDEAGATPMFRYDWKSSIIDTIVKEKTS